LSASADQIPFAKSCGPPLIARCHVLLMSAIAIKHALLYGGGQQQYLAFLGVA
jgi:hypothetical protein